MVDSVARCGIKCDECMHFDKECRGCENENEFNNRCLIFNCSTEKDIKNCLQCEEFPCKLMKGLSKAYCPVYSKIKLSKPGHSQYLK